MSLQTLIESAFTSFLKNNGSAITHASFPENPITLVSNPESFSADYSYTYTAPQDGWLFVATSGSTGPDWSTTQPWFVAQSYMIKQGFSDSPYLWGTGQARVPLKKGDTGHVQIARCNATYTYIYFFPCKGL